MNDLWCQGFFGKGSLSRSEPSWMLREKARERDRLEAANAAVNTNKNAESKTSEQRTNRRREERADTKWERGRLALEAIEKRKQEEAEAARLLEAAAAVAETETVEAVETETETYIFIAPVGPLELLALPNSDAELLARRTPRAKAEVKAEAATHIDSAIPRDAGSHIYTFKPPVGPLELLALPNSAADLAALQQPKEKKAVNGTAHMNGSANGSAVVKPKAAAVPEFKRQKSVRFSSTVESTTFGRTDPPSPNIRDMSPEQADATPKTTPTSTIVNKEHLQLAPEEAFFLSYALGALRVVDDTGRELSTQELFWLFAENASFPPTPSVAPDSTAFLTSYSVYHHFRALGWVPRHGIKFGVDWMLYGKGPALDHAEFGVMVMPGRVDQKENERGEAKSWHWLHSINRVLSTVYKSMVLVYVNVPAMPTDKSADVDVTALLKAVEIRDVVVRRWSSNRNRD